MGQTFLADATVARNIVEAADINERDVVLEIGGGLGILTRWLVRSAKRVFVIEISRQLVRALTERFGNRDNVQIIRGDALRIPLPRANKVVSNLPYHISSEMTFRLIREVPFRLAVLMYQEEFAERLLADPGSREYSRLTVDVRYKMEVERVLHVPAEKFYPVPAVDSMVVKLQPRQRGPFAKNEDVFYWLVRGVFAYPNKTTRKAFRLWLKSLNLEGDSIDRVLAACHDHLEQAERVRHLSLETLVSIADILWELVEQGTLPFLGGKTSETRGR